MLPSFISQAEEEIEYSHQSGEDAAEAHPLERIMSALKTQDRKQLEHTVSNIRNEMPNPCHGVLAALLDTIDVEMLGKPRGRIIRCPSCDTPIRSLMDRVYLARLTCPTCHAEVVYSDEGQ